MPQRDELPGPWPEVFELMWEAYLAGTVPVGAAVVDESGEIVSRARNRIFDETSDGQLGRSRLAHAELNALVPLTSERTYEGFTLYTSLEPCHLCLSAAMSVRIGGLQYAARDPYSGAVGKLVPSAAHQTHPLKVTGPLPGPPGQLPELLHLAHHLWRVPNGSLTGFYRSERPNLVAVAQTLPTPGSRATLADAFTVLNS